MCVCVIRKHTYQHKEIDKKIRSHMAVRFLFAASVDLFFSLIILQVGLGSVSMQIIISLADRVNGCVYRPVSLLTVLCLVVNKSIERKLLTGSITFLS